MKPEKAERVNTHIQKEKPVYAENAVPYGLGGQPSMSYTQIVSGAGEGGLSFGEGGDFGERYGWYVASVRNRISGNWLLSTISPSILKAPRLYMTFTILRDGSYHRCLRLRSQAVYRKWTALPCGPFWLPTRCPRFLPTTQETRSR